MVADFSFLEPGVFLFQYRHVTPQICLHVKNCDPRPLIRLFALSATSWKDSDLVLPSAIRGFSKQRPPRRRTGPSYFTWCLKFKLCPFLQPLYLRAQPGAINLKLPLVLQRTTVFKPSLLAFVFAYRHSCRWTQGSTHPDGILWFFFSFFIIHSFHSRN